VIAQENCRTTADITFTVQLIRPKMNTGTVSGKAAIAHRDGKKAGNAMGGHNS
jgi:hypothetical protein